MRSLCFLFFSIYCNQSNGLDQDGEKGMDSGYILKVDSTGLADGLDEGNEGQGGHGELKLSPLCMSKNLTCQRGRGEGD